MVSRKSKVCQEEDGKRMLYAGHSRACAGQCNVILGPPSLFSTP